ncbi:DUF1883 domain-containing protein [Nonomuraea sp. NPDC046802]|uniref:DUF1883 domain-containing protein n=1 Tax=Nonomuraea sp. NPDC046802 TaxID=3154919 RepID=UPI0034100DB6
MVCEASVLGPRRNQGRRCFEVDWRGSTARVALMDGEEYQAYLDEEAYQNHGGFFDYSPLVLRVPYDDYWYLIVDSYDRVKNVTVVQLFD